METMGDLLEKVREFASRSFTEDEAKMLFGWEVKDISTRGAKTDESHVVISFENEMVLYINYFLNLDPTETEDNCEFILALRTDLRSRVKYSVHYSKYIHGQGYMRLKVAETDNRMVQSMIEEYYVPALKMIYKPIISQFQGFYEMDYFGVQADNNYGQIYYAPVRFRSEYKKSSIWDVTARLQALDALLREPEIRHALAELDLQMSFLPDVVGSSI